MLAGSLHGQQKVASPNSPCATTFDGAFSNQYPEMGFSNTSLAAPCNFGTPTAEIS
jgi:hypothetical protein